jgi:enoyl-CoA hydratase
MSNGKVQVEVRADGVRTIHLDDPDKRNALSFELLDDLLEALEDARDDDDTRCVVLASTHEKVFCAGGNLAAFADDAPIVAKHRDNDRLPRLFKLLAELGKPSICAANGHALKEGLTAFLEKSDPVWTGL